MLNIQATALPYDELYEALIQAHEGLSIEQSHAIFQTIAAKADAPGAASPFAEISDDDIDTLFSG